MKNIDVVKGFFEMSRSKHTLNLHYNMTFNELVNYNTILLKRDPIKNIIYVNITYYSVTTSKIQSYINEFLNSRYTDDYQIMYYFGNRYGDNYMDVVKEYYSYGYNDNYYYFIKFTDESVQLLRFYKKAYLNSKYCKIFNKKDPYIKIDNHKIDLYKVNNNDLFTLIK